MVNYLADIFIVLFIVSFIFTICGLAGWIKIEDKYLSRLFTVVIITGVVSGVVTLFTNNFLNASPEYDLVVEPQEGWFAWNLDKGEIFQPVVKAMVNSEVVDTVVLGLNKKNIKDRLMNRKFSIMPIDQRYMIAKDESQPLGYIPDSSLRNNNFFNALEDITKKGNSTKITFRKNANGLWNKPPIGKFIEGTPYELEMAKDGRGVYTIIENGTPEEFSIGKDSRALHFHESHTNQKKFYLLYVDAAVDTAKVNKANNFVRFIQLKLEPIISYPK